MASAKDKTKAAPAKQVEAPPAKKDGGAYLFMLIGVIFVGLMLFATPALLVFVVGCVPAIVAFIIDREPGRNATLAVAAANVAGVAPFIVELLVAGLTMARATAMLSDVFVIAVVRGTAGIGWLLVLEIP